MAEFKKDKNQTPDSESRGDVIFGRNPVSEAIRSGRPLDSILVSKGARTGAIVGILAKAKDKNIRIKEVDPKKLDYMCSGGTHQGIAAVGAVCEYKELEDIFSLAKDKGEDPFIIILDEIEDPHNLGAIIRTAECAGAHGVIIPNRRSAGLSFIVGKTAAGATEYVPVVRVPNIPSVIETLKQRGVWVFGADMNGEDYRKCNFKGPVALVIGNEGKGIGRLVREKCDVIVSLPMKGKINSLNASVAAGILMYKIADSRP
ncbi:MAG: 23S rRNA (guanosine(2251)-2'-O)-methyltransferase RlmB [Ruminococcus sp.]|nr:23S rRNA (guanosine(2251)-2'-O)-methyltransferase RlmB [Ruminococcus sp.]